MAPTEVPSPPAASRPRPSAGAGHRLAATHRVALLAGAVLFLVAHLPLLGTTLADIDAYNFALGVQDYDPALHQPHPPGYPLYIGLAKLSTSTLDAVRPEPAHGLAAGERNAAQGLAIWSALGGTAAVLLLPLVFTSLSRAGKRSLDRRLPTVVGGATLLTVTCPLFWFSSGRPLSDIPGLAGALLAQAAILAVYLRARDSRVAPWHLAGAAFLTTLVVGLRSQTMWLTLPLLAVVVAVRWRAVPRAEWWRAACAGLAGVLVWAVPMIAASGGLAAYVGALGAQGAEDFTGVDMLFRNPTPVRLAAGMVHTFVWPWASVPLGTVVLGLAALGGCWLLVTAPRVLLIGLAAFGPYAVFHLLFHETITTRYALPLVPPIAWLSAAGVAFAAGRLAAPALAAAAIWGLAVTWPAAIGY
ncbi:MAG TPA: hypothetical protein VK911_02325, partial [Vicinamibacterales bacterium]|nr:hypothetical protein [Vicinamibacterales bacterium]